MAAVALQIDSREPLWIKGLSFGGLPTATMLLPQGDALIACDDGQFIIVERKTVDDLLGSIKDGRVFVQVSEMTTVTRWVYVVVCGPIMAGPNGNIISGRGETGWSFNSVWGALLTIQELGAFVVFCASDTEYEATLLRLANRSRETAMLIEPAKLPHILSISEQIIASLPGIGIEKLKSIMDMSGGIPAVALMALTDPDSEIPGIGPGIKRKIRNALKLAENEQMLVTTDDVGHEIFGIIKNYAKVEEINE